MTREAQIIEAMFRIPTKEGEDVDFHLNEAQARLDSAITGRDLVPKARQEGVSSYVLARFLAACLMYRNTHAVVISHDMESTQRLLARVQYYIKNIRGPAPVVQNMSKNLITFSKMGSMFYIGTAGSRKFGRGDTITHLHCSEYAYWPDAIGLMKGLLQAVPYSGEVIVESTGNGFNDYYRRCIRSFEGKSIWAMHFLPWHTFGEYSLELSDQEREHVLDSINIEWEEDKLLAFGLSLEQLAWRRMKLDELEYDLQAFKQEYPLTLDECFQATGHSIFHRVRFEPTVDWGLVEPGLWALAGHPQSGMHYVNGVDVGGGVGKNSSVCEIFCIETSEQVAEFTNNRLDPEIFAERVAGLSRAYNQAYTVVENNNHGILTVATLRKIYDPGLIHKDVPVKSHTEEKRLLRIGYHTTTRNKPLMIGRLRTLLANEWTIHSPLLRTQLSTFVEHEDGKLAAQEGCDDDAVMAAACAGVGSVRAALLAKPPSLFRPSGPDPFVLSTILDELHSRNKGFPIADQVN